jgi:hypothetical protein
MGLGIATNKMQNSKSYLMAFRSPLIRRMNSPLSHGHLESFNGLEMTFNYIDNM